MDPEGNPVNVEDCLVQPGKYVRGYRLGPNYTAIEGVCYKIKGKWEFGQRFKHERCSTATEDDAGETKRVHEAHSARLMENLTGPGPTAAPGGKRLKTARQLPDVFEERQGTITGEERKAAAAAASDSDSSSENFCEPHMFRRAQVVCRSF